MPPTSAPAPSGLAAERRGRQQASVMPRPEIRPGALASGLPPKRPAALQSPELAQRSARHARDVLACAERRGSGGAQLNDDDGSSSQHQPGARDAASRPKSAAPRPRTGRLEDGRRGAASLGVDAPLRAQALRFRDPAAGPLAAADLQRRKLWEVRLPEINSKSAYDQQTTHIQI